MSSRLLQPITNILNHTRDLKKGATAVAGDLQTEAINQRGRLKDIANSGLSNARSRAGDSWRMFNCFIKQHPFVAVGIVTGVILAASAASRRN